MGQQPSLRENLRKERLIIKQKERVIDREIAAMNMEMEKSVQTLKKEIKKNNIVTAKFIAKNYAMIKRNINNLHKMKNQITALCIQMQMMKSQNEINEAMSRVTSTMKILNHKMNLHSVKEIIKEFEQEKLKQEVTNEMIETMMDADDEDEETEEEILNKVCDELQISLMESMREPPTDEFGLVQSPAISNTYF